MARDHENHEHHDEEGVIPHHVHSHDLRKANRKKVTIVFALTVGYMFVEAVGGWMTNSLALLSDAGHMLTDAGALGLALLAFWLASRPMSPKHNFGLYRMEIVAAFINGMVLILLSALIVHEAILRLANPPTVEVRGMLVIAAVGLVVNLIGAYVLSRGDGDNLNLKGALFHVIGDALGSVGAIVAALVIMYTGWLPADPIASFVISGIIVVGAVRLVLDSVHVILEGTPKAIDLVAVESAILDHPGVTNVHDLHVWTITSGFESLSAHVVLADGVGDFDCIIADLGRTLMEKFNINHTTIQVERERCGGACCVTCPSRESAKEIV